MNIDPVLFMANMALVAHADGTLSSTELGQLEAIRKELKFKKSDYNAAINLVHGEEYKITPIGSFADKVKNLELMLRVAYADNDLDQTEVSLIREFCKEIGIHQEQLNILCKEVIASLKKQDKICPSCGAENNPEAQFCSKCGTNLIGESKNVQVEFQIPSTGIALEFAESTAASFNDALKIAKLTDKYQTCMKGKKRWHLVVFSSGQLSDALPLAEALAGMRNRKLCIDGQEKQWNEVFGFIYCASQRNIAYRPIEYCFGKDENRLNLWGCKQTRMDWTEWADWFCYGKWEKKGILGQKLQWRFDKKRIKHELATNLFQYRFCPHMNTDLPEAILRNFPEVIAPESDPYWDFHRQYEETPGAIKIVQKEATNGFTYSEEFWADGVKPKGLRFFNEILTKAFKDLKMSTAIIKGLLK